MGRLPSVSPGVSSFGLADSTVLGVETANPNFVFNVNVPAAFYEKAVFTKDVELKGQLIAPNIVNSIKGGTGISVGSGNNPTITNTGVTSLGSKTGDLKLEAETGITIDGLKITSKDISLVAGGGISVSGYTITNDDRGTAQKIFKTITVGSTSFSAGSNTDTLIFAGTSGITVTPDTSTKTLTISASGSDLNVSGWTDDGTTVRLTTSTDNVGIGTTAASPMPGQSPEPQDLPPQVLSLFPDYLPVFFTPTHQESFPPLLSISPHLM